MRRSLLLVLMSSFSGAVALAQSTTTGAVQGTVIDEANGEPLAGATITVVGPALQQPQSAFADERGGYFVSNLPPGDYTVIFSYGTAVEQQPGVLVMVGKTATVAHKLNQKQIDVITIKERAPTIDGGSTKIGATMGQDYFNNVPARGRTYAAFTGAAAGSFPDLYGPSFGGSTSPENAYNVDGVNTTGLTFGGIGSPLLTNFIQEIEIITGGYNAEFGRSTGGVVNVVTKTGSNEFHGSVWGNLSPWEAARQSVAVAGDALEERQSLAPSGDFGFDLGGPIIKDRLWFYVGFAPVFTRTNVTRIAATQVDRQVNGARYDDPSCRRNNDGTCDGDGNPATTSAPGCEAAQSCEGDGVPDIDPATGFARFEEVDRRSYVGSTTQYQFTGKLSFALGPDHQGTLSVTGSPTTGTRILGVAGTDTANQMQIDGITTDASFRWTSKLDNGRTQLDAVLGWHHDSRRGRSIDASTMSAPRTDVFLDDPTYSNLGAVGRNHDRPESRETLALCTDNDPTVADPFPSITNCPVTAYSMNSLGTVIDKSEDRIAGTLALTQRFRAAGHHQLKAGVDLEDNLLYDRRNFSGGRLYQSFGDWETTQFVKLDPSGTDVCGFDENGAPRMCKYLDELPVHGATTNLAAFLQDSWSILPNLTVNAGLRWERQAVGYSSEIQDTIDLATGKRIGAEALVMNDLVAPRLGAIWDWTKEGRSKVYGSWGRFYESIPMDINERSFGGEAQYLSFWDWQGQCGLPPTGADDPRLPSLPENCPRGPSADGMTTPGNGDGLIGGGSSSLVLPAGVTLGTPGIKPQYVDELVACVELEPVSDLRVGVSWQHRTLGRVLEDMSPDGGSTYILANPGELDAGAEHDLEQQIAQMPAGDQKTFLQNRLDVFRGVRKFDKPSRTYDAIQITAVKRFSRSFMMQGSYTWSRLIGNYPGLFAPDTTQLDPNITAQYDLPELLANQYGLLPHDHTHSFKLDGYYAFDLGPAGRIIAGASVRALSGAPITPLGRHELYGPSATYILPRGASGRTAFEANADLHLAWSRKLGPTDLSIFVEIYNILNTQEEVGVDNEYTKDVVRAVSGGTEEDLPYLVRSGGNLARKKVNYGNTVARMQPLGARFGMTLAF